MGGNRNYFIKDADTKLLLGLAAKVVRCYVMRKAVPQREQDDVIMAVLEKFLNQKAKIDSAFQGRSKLSTYYASVMNRMCCEIIRIEGKHWKSVSEVEIYSSEKSNTSTSEDSSYKILLKMELQRLESAIRMLGHEEHKTRLFLKFYFGLPVTRSEIKCFSGDKSGQVSEIVKHEKPRSKGETFEVLAKIIQVSEGKSVKGDAVRMWLNKQIDKIIACLNYNDCSNHTRESIEILLEMQFLQKSDPNLAMSLKLLIWFLIIVQ